VAVVKFLVKEGLSEGSGQRERSRREGTTGARSRREEIFEHRKRNMLIYEERPECAKLMRKAAASPRVNRLGWSEVINRQGLTHSPDRYPRLVRITSDISKWRFFPTRNVGYSYKTSEGFHPMMFLQHAAGSFDYDCDEGIREIDSSRVLAHFSHWEQAA